MENTEKQSITEQEARDFLRSYINEERKQNQVAKELGVSNGLVSGFLSGKYSCPHTVIPKIQELMSVSEQKAIAPKDPKYVTTSVSRDVFNAITYSRIQGKVSVVYGDAGIGKTMAIQQYCKEYNSAVNITITAVYANISGATRLLARELGVKEKNVTMMFEEIVSRLEGSDRVIIIDEAQHLTSKTIDYLRQISEFSRVGMVFVGNHTIIQNFEGKREDDLSQLFSRIGMNVPLTTGRLSKEDIKAIFEGLDEECLEILFKISRTKYGLRGAVNVYTNTAIVYKGNITPSKLAAVARNMRIG